MSDDDRLRRMLQSALPPTKDDGPSRDLWPRVAGRTSEPKRWEWFDVSLAAAVSIVLVLFPEWLVLLAYHL